MTGSYEKNDRVYTLVVGLGTTGMSVVRYLHSLGEKIIVVDSRELPPGLKQLKQNYADVEVHTGGFETGLFTAAHRIVVSPGVPLSEPALQQAKEKGVEITGDIDLFAQHAVAPVVGITGSNGKSTVTMLLSAMAEKAGFKVGMGGNIGTPVLDLLQNESELYVLELSSFQLETLVSLQLEVAVVLNISPDHLDRYDDLNSYAMYKHLIYTNANTMVVNRDDPLASGSIAEHGRVTGFTLGEPDEHDFGVRCSGGDCWLCHGQEKLIDVDELRIKGSHNTANALAALAMGSLLDLPMPAMLSALREFTGLAHRTQWVACVNEVNWFNDSKATNVGASIAAIQGLPGRHVLIAGGEGKQADFAPLRDVAEKHLRAAVLIGRDAALIEQALGGVVPVSHAADMGEAVALAAGLAQAGDNVLLSPACASFDMFNNFEHRGDVFMRAVQERVS